jgi:hypothetical protein
MGLTVTRSAARIVGGHHQTDVARWDRTFGRHLDDGVVWICACIDPIDDGIERVS